MNCINHPEAAVSAYCQNCGKPLCAQCVRQVSGVIYCEQCLAARLGMPGAGYAQPGSSVRDTAQFVAGLGLPASGAPVPVAAAVLGLIPGVGAMYNGQFVKALIHVLIFVVLIGLSSHYGVFGIFIAAWVLYQIFDAYQTAVARRDGLPLPDPFGFNDLGNRLGYPPRAYPAQSASQAAPASGQPYQAPTPPPPGPYPDPYSPYAAAATQYPPPMPPAACGRPEPVGAIVLIIVGMLFLFSTLGVFQFDWVDHGWPVIIIAIGVWLLVRRSRGMRHQVEAAPMPPSVPPAGPSAGPSSGSASGGGL